jgi:hypothetical protein
VTLPLPEAWLRCGTIAVLEAAAEQRTQSAEQVLSVTSSDVRQLLVSQDVVWRVPVGNTRHTLIIAAGTQAAQFVCAIAIITAMWW